MTDVSRFDRIMCCVFVQNICNTFNIFKIIVLLNILNTFISGILIIISLLSSFNNTPKGDTFFLTGVIMHIISLCVELILTTYPSRYLYGMENGDIGSSKKSCFTNYDSYVFKTYILWMLYFVFMITILFTIGLFGINSTNIYNDPTLGVILYILSFNIVGYWTLVFKPCIGHRKGMIYDEDVLGIDSQISLAFLFVISFLILNNSEWVYYNNIILHYALSIISLFFTVTAFVIEAIIFISKRLNNESVSIVDTNLWFWCLVLFITTVLSIVFFAYVLTSYIPNKQYPETSYLLQIFFIGQGSLSLLTISIIGVYYIIKLLIRCIRTCCKKIPDDLQNARGRVYSFGSLDDTLTTDGSNEEK